MEELLYKLSVLNLLSLPFQFCPGGELFDYIVAKERLKVSVYRAVLCRLCSYLSENYYCPTTDWYM